MHPLPLDRLLDVLTNSVVGTLLGVTSAIGGMATLGMDWTRIAEHGPLTVFILVVGALTGYGLAYLVRGIRYAGEHVFDKKTGIITQALRCVDENSKHTQEVAEVLHAHEESTSVHVQACVESGNTVQQIRDALLQVCREVEEGCHKDAVDRDSVLRSVGRIRDILSSQHIR